MTHYNASRLQAYARLTRVSNLPTVVTNVLVGCALGAKGMPLAWGHWLLLSLALGLIYVGGAMMNDVADTSADRVENPHRPIPAGRVGWIEANLLMFVALGVGMWLLLEFYPTGAVVTGGILVACMTLYNIFHRRFVWTCLLMGACRSLLVVLVVVAVGGKWWATGPMGVALLLGTYTVLVTLVGQAGAGSRLRWRATLGWVIPFVPLLAFLFMRPAIPWLAIFAAGAVTGWLVWGGRFLLRRPSRARQAVMAWIAGICLMDMLFLVFFGQPIPALIALAAFGLTAVAHRRVHGS